MKITAGAIVVTLACGWLLAGEGALADAPNNLDDTKPVTALPAAKRAPKLIEWGWDQQTIEQVHANLAKMEAAPFDGIVMGALGWWKGERLDLDHLFWGKRALPREAFQTAIDLLKSTPFKHFTDNFIHIGLDPGGVDWYDDEGWKAIVNNADIAGWICKEGGLKGLVFDTEQYQERPFSYQTRAQRAVHSFDDYTAKARQRGRELAQALCAEKPDITILFTYLPSYLQFNDTAPSEWKLYGLLPAFLDGLLEGSTPQTQFVDGLEMAYPNKQAKEFAKLKQGVKEARKWSAVPKLYDAKMQAAFGLWLDNGWREKGYGFNPTDTQKNWFQPAELRKSLQIALQQTDRYVWLWSETVHWWDGKNLSPAYRDAISQGRADGITAALQTSPPKKSDKTSSP